MPSLLGVTDSSSFRIHFPRPCSAHPNISSRSPTISEPNSIRCSTPGPPASSRICFSVPKLCCSTATHSESASTCPHVSKYPCNVPKCPASSIELPVTPPTFLAVPSCARDEDWGQSIFQWGGELGPGPTLCAFLQRRTHSTSFIFAHIRHSDSLPAAHVQLRGLPTILFTPRLRLPNPRLSDSRAPQSPLISTFCPRYATCLLPAYT